MKSIYELQQIANHLRAVTEADSISPEDTFGLQSDVLAYIADMEQSADGLGIRKVYKTKAAMEADTEPVGTNGKVLRYGQLVSVYDTDNAASPENGNIYAWQKPGWRLMGNMGSIYELKEKIEAEAEARKDTDNMLSDRISGLTKYVSDTTETLQGNIDIEEVSRNNADRILEKNIEKERAERVSACAELLNSISEEANSRESADTALGKRIDGEKSEREIVFDVVDKKCDLALSGATARFDGFVDDAEIKPSTASGTDGDIIYVKAKGKFAFNPSGSLEYYGSFPMYDLYNDASGAKKDKVFVSGDRAYIWGSDSGKLVEIPDTVLLDKAVMGATLAFGGFADIGEDADFFTSEDDFASDKILFSRKTGGFVVVQTAGEIYTSWLGSGLYNDSNGKIQKERIYVYNGKVYVWDKGEQDLVEISGGGGGNILNVTELYPLNSGYYTLSSAIKAVEEKLRGNGRCVTFEVSQGKWETKQFTGTSLAVWEQPASWEDFGGAGTLKSLTVNGEKKLPDAEGNVSLTIEKTEVDESLNAESTNPVENRAVAAKLGELEAGTIFGANAELSDDETSVRLTLTNKSGAEVVAVDLPAGSGGSGDSGSTTKIVLGAGVNNPTVKEGGAVMLTYTYDHQYSSGDEKGESTGQKAKITVQIRRGATTTYSETTQDVSRGTYTVDLTKYLLAGTSDIYVTAETTDPATGKAQKKQAYVSVRSVTLALSSSYNIASGLSSGGYGSQESASIPYAVSGTGTKTVTLYVDGMQKEAHTVTRSGTTNGSFSIPMSGLSVGRHTVQMVAEMDAGDGLTLKSESIYLDFLKAGSSAPYVGLMVTHRDGRILTGTAHLIPVIEVGQYENCEFRFAAYDPGTTPASVAIYRNGTLLQTVSVPRTAQTYRNRFTEQGLQQMQFKVGGTTYPFHIDVTESGIDISETTYGLQVKLSPSGRSNGESDPARWESGGVKTTFEGFDWSSNGWTGDSLKLTNGAKAVIGYPLFKNDAGASGATIEMEFRMSNVAERGAEVISCMDGGKGLSVTTEEASIKTGTILHYTNEDGGDASREIKIGTKFAPEKWLKVAFVIGRRTEGRLMELYVNGNRAGADIYDNSYYFRQDNPAGITIDSGMADVEVRNIRIYDRALTDDEVLENRMVDADSMDDMMRLYEENDILGDTGDVDIDKLRAKGKGVMRIVRKGGLDEVNETNNKKTDFLADVYFWSPFGKEYDFVLRDCYIRIQGTSSTKYPSKNIRIYFSKGGANLSFEINGVVQGDGNYTMRPGSIPMNLFCLKSDYSDSSMSLNTGVAKLYNDVMLELGLLTPPQRHQLEQAGGDLNAVKIRQSIDGFPIDVFSAESVDGESTYYGQYNFNNEKSKSGKLFGMEGVDGYTPACPLTLETLNNGEKVCLFQSTSDDDLAANFDAGLETNWPDDVKWAGLSTAQQSALKRLYGWIRACVPSNATADDLATFASPKFKAEVSQYFDVKHLLTYYIHTDYFASVDQRAKNILLRMWDSLVWYTTYYDGDSQLAKRNDCFLAYDYTLDRDTWDAEAGKYAFEGRESWLWNLVLANLQDDLKSCAAAYRSKMTVERVLSMLDGEQAGNWSDRAYNKSGYLKYIRPNMEEVYGKKWPFIYALQGSNAAHREYFIRNRFALLDAKYGTSNFTSDNIDLYMARSASDSVDAVRITSSEIYAFGYGTNNSPNIANTGIVQAGEVATLQITGAYTVNDPLRIYGASRMRVLDMTGSSDRLKNSLDLGKCTVLRELNLQSSGTGSTGWWLNLGSCRQLRKVNLRNQAQAKTGSSTSTELDFTNQTKLEELDARGTQVQSVTFAKGAPLTKASLPGTLTVLKLEYLSRLTTVGLTLEGYTNVKTLIVDSCSGLSWETLLSRCTGTERIRVTGIDREDDGTWLNKFMNMGGVDAEGNATDTCALVGTVRLTRYMDEELYQRMCIHFPELNIIQPEYTMIEFDCDVEDSANISNLDNCTGYKYGTKYIPSAHISRILSKRHRVLSKRIDLQTAVICMLHDRNSYYFADTDKISDATPAALTGEMGDIMLFEPHYWSKGVNNLLENKIYSLYSSKDDCPSQAPGTHVRLDYGDIAVLGNSAVRALEDYSTISEAMISFQGLSACTVNVRGYRQIRYPGLKKDSYGAVFTDSDGNIIKRLLPKYETSCKNGQYFYTQIPENATDITFTVADNAPFDYVLLTTSSDINAIEPEWVEHKECLVGVTKASLVNRKLRSIKKEGVQSICYLDIRHYIDDCQSYGVLDYAQYRDFANLFFAAYGTRDSQETTGYGRASVFNDGLGPSHMAFDIGMTDTFPDYNNPYPKNGAWIWDDETHERTKDIQNNNVLGYEMWGTRGYEIMDGIFWGYINNREYRFFITEPDGTERSVFSIPYNAGTMYPSRVWHGKYMDILIAESKEGSNSSHYPDRQYQSGISLEEPRVVRNGGAWSADAGVVSLTSGMSKSNSNDTNTTTRIMFRGNIIWAESVDSFINIDNFIK